MRIIACSRSSSVEDQSSDERHDMEEECGDPYEQQLLAVFKSCLEEGQSELDQEGLFSLCEKLQLDDSSKDSIAALLKCKSIEKTLSFSEFRNGFLALLDKAGQDSTMECNESNENNIESHCSLETTDATPAKYNPHFKLGKSYSEAMICPLMESERNFDSQSLPKTWREANSSSIEGLDLSTSALSKHTIEVIFDKLDLDCDGLIGLGDFLNFFRDGNKILQQISSSTRTVGIRRGINKLDSRKENAPIFGPHQNGYVLRNLIVEMWEMSGVPGANLLLSELGFDMPTVNLNDLVAALSTELKLSRDVSYNGISGEYVKLLKGSLSLYQDEVRHLNSTMEHLRCERDKLRNDIVEANERANLLAQEVDEHQVRMEKARQDQLTQLEFKHSESMKDLTNHMNHERDKNLGTLKLLGSQLEASQQEEQRIRNELATVMQELRLLEAENLNQSEEIIKLEEYKSQLSLQVQELAAAQEQAENEEARENEHVASLRDHIKHLQSELTVLRDHNDELTSELEIIKLRENDLKILPLSTELNSSLSTENEGHIVSAPEMSDAEDECHVKHKVLGKLNKSKNTNKIAKITRKLKRLLQADKKCCFDCCGLRDDLSLLVNELEVLDSYIMLTPEENCKNLAKELETCREVTKDFVSSKTEKNLIRRSKSDEAIYEINEYSENPCQENHNTKLSLNNSVKKETSCLDSIEGEKNADSVDGQLQALKLQDQNAILTERCVELEKSIELLRYEYEQCEDYWAEKLEEERKIFDQEQKINDEKFTELLNKLAEFHEQFDSRQDDGRLSPIEEKPTLEQQYEELEMEYEKWRLKTEEELSDKGKEIESLRTKLQDEKKQRKSFDFSVQFPEDKTSDNVDTVDVDICSKFNLGKEFEYDDVIFDGERLVTQKSKKSLQKECKCRTESNVISLGNKICHHALKRLMQRKPSIDIERDKLYKLKEKLKHDIENTQNLRMSSSSNYYSRNDLGLHPKCNDINLLSLCNKLQAQQLEYLQVCNYIQQRDNDKLMEEMWKQHIIEVNDLEFVIQITQEKLERQIELNEEQNKRLIKADKLTTDLFVENANLIKNMKHLEQHCQILAKSAVESTVSSATTP